MKIGYARVSSDDQELHLQLDALNDIGCDKIYTEKASGKVTNRPELEKALDNLRKGDMLVVWRLDRLGRSLPHLIETVNDLKARNIGFVSITEAIDTSSPAGELIFHIFGAIAQFERSLISERTKAGLAAAKRRGKSVGRKPSMSLNDIRLAASMLFSETVTKTEVAKYFGVSRPTLDKALKRITLEEN
ncbi:TPA: recombinase family protein [Vibrio parahaemolyticus]